LSRKNTLPLAGFTVTFTVVAEAGNGREALQVYRQIKPDVVLMDLRLPEVGGVEATMSIRKEFPDARVIILTTFDMDEDIYRAIDEGPHLSLCSGAQSASTMVAQIPSLPDPSRR